MKKLIKQILREAFEYKKPELQPKKVKALQKYLIGKTFGGDDDRFGEEGFVITQVAQDPGDGIYWVLHDPSDVEVVDFEDFSVVRKLIRNYFNVSEDDVYPLANANITHAPYREALNKQGKEDLNEQIEDPKIAALKKTFLGKVFQKFDLYFRIVDVISEQDEDGIFYYMLTEHIKGKHKYDYPHWVNIRDKCVKYFGIGVDHIYYQLKDRYDIQNLQEHTLTDEQKKVRVLQKLLIGKTCGIIRLPSTYRKIINVVYDPITNDYFVLGKTVYSKGIEHENAFNGFKAIRSLAKTYLKIEPNNIFYEEYDGDLHDDLITNQGIGPGKV